MANLSDTYIGLHFLPRVGIEEKLCLFVGFDLLQRMTT